MAAVWIAADHQLAFTDVATNGHHCRGTKMIPFSLPNVDEVLDDLGLNIRRRVRALHRLNPVDADARSAVLGRPA